MIGAEPRIGYYVHHHGGGHASRAGAIAARFEGEVTLLSSLPSDRLPAVPSLALPLDAGEGREEAPAELHFAPLGSVGLRGRMALIAAWLAREAPDLVVVDVSVEVAALVRLCGVPVVYARQLGTRADPPHRLAYGWSERLLAPYPAWIESEDTPAATAARTFYAGSVTRFDGAPRPARAAPQRAARALVLGADRERLAVDLATAAPDWLVHLASASPAPRSAPPNLRLLAPGQVNLELFASSAVVVSAAGANTVAEAAFAGCGLICLPQPRPFEEQVARAAALERSGAAVVLGAPPDPRTWPALLREALGRQPLLADWADGRGTIRAARFLGQLAREVQTSASSSSRSSSQRTRPTEESSLSQPLAGQVPQVR